MQVRDESTCVSDVQMMQPQVFLGFFFVVVFGVKSKAVRAENRLDEASCES